MVQFALSRLRYIENIAGQPKIQNVFELAKSLHYQESTVASFAWAHMAVSCFYTNLKAAFPCSTSV